MQTTKLNPRVLSVALVIAAMLTILSNAIYMDIARHKVVPKPLIDSPPYNRDCVIDELGWIDDVEFVQSGLQNFYDSTGIQPIVYLHAYDSSLTSDSAKQEWTDNWYYNNAFETNTFAIVYFANESTADLSGTFIYHCGSSAAAIFDDVSLDILMTFIDCFWSDEMFSPISSDILPMTASTALVSILDETAEYIFIPPKLRLSPSALITAGILLLLAIILILSGRKNKELI
ncbi:MAG: hypothetical protein NC548_10775 [Lachnospiraceae bacterium]|nr:hypothetical protein [Lachnospiraceae bacterium]